MTTFTLGLGAQGKMLFSPSYWTDTSEDFASVKNGVTADPANGVCSWMAAGSRCVWPTPSSDDPANIDDLWHAAVNGRGSYFSATDPTSLATGLASTLGTIVDTPRPGTSAAAASSNPNVSAGDNYVFSSYYKSVDWYGDLYRQRFDIVTQGLSSAVDWSASAMLDCATTSWTASKAYVAGDAYRNGNACYLVTTDYVAGTTFSATDTDNSAIVTYSPASCHCLGAQHRLCGRQHLFTGYARHLLLRHQCLYLGRRLRNCRYGQHERGLCRRGANGLLDALGSQHHLRLG